MKLLTKILLLMTSLFISTAIFAAPINPINISAENLALIKEINHQCAQASFTESQACEKKLHDRLLLEGKFRGTTRYAEVHYKKLGDKKLVALLEQLRQLKKKARDLSDALMDPVDGELTDEKYDAEIQWIVGELKTRGVRVSRE